MKTPFTIVLSFAWVAAQAQPIFPPVPGNDFNRSNYGLEANLGWVLDSYGEPRPDVQFVTEGASPRTYIRKDATMSFTVTSVDTAAGGTDTLRRLDMELIGEMAAHPDALGSSQRDQWRNYYLPHCGPMGVTQVPSYNRIVYEGIYPLIDLWVFSGYYGQKMMFVVHPGGDPADISMKFTGQNQMDVDVNGWLRLLLQDRWITLPEAVAYQYDQNNTISFLNWGASYSANNNSGIASFNFDTYDTTKPLVFLIGPPPPFMGGPSVEETGLCWSTYLGDDGNDDAQDVRSDSDNNLYVTGSTSSTILQFPADPGVVYALSGNGVAYMTKFDPLHQLSWTVFYGGNLLESSSSGHAIAISETPVRRIYIGGKTNAEDLETMPSGTAFWDGTNTSSTNKGFIFECDGEEGLMSWATYFGEHDVEVRGIAVTPENNLVICGSAQNDLPVLQYGPPTNSLYQSYGGGFDGFIAMFDEDRQLFWRSWWGGPGSDIALCVRATDEKIVLAGHTSYSGFSMTDPGGGAYSAPYGGGTGDVYLIEFDTDGVVQWSSYLGGNGQDQLGPKGLSIGQGGDVFLCGVATAGLGIIQGPNWYDDVSSGNNGFIARFDGVDRSPKWITYLGAGTPHLLYAIEQGDDGLISVTGWTTDDQLPHEELSGTYEQNGLYETVFGAFLIQFKPDQELLHATWFGGDEGTQMTCGRSLCTNSDGVFVVGFTRKASDPNAYFPLDYGQGIPWFDWEYNHLAESVNGDDAFVTWFCQELGVGLGDEQQSVAVPPVVVVVNDMLILHGQPEGPREYQIIDASGHLVSSGRLTSSAQYSTPIPLSRLASGVYGITIRGGASVKFIKP